MDPVLSTRPWPSAPTFYLPSHGLKSSLHHPEQKWSLPRLSLASGLSLPSQGLLGLFPVSPSCTNQGKGWLSTRGQLGPGSWEGWEKRPWSHPRLSPFACSRCEHNSLGCSTSLSTGVWAAPGSRNEDDSTHFPTDWPQLSGSFSESAQLGTATMWQALGS